jgi:hypothetical protein
MSSFGIGSIKNALSTALNALPDWTNLNNFEKGHTIDKAFKSIFKDLMNQFGMKPGIDYVDSLKENEECTDFVTLSQDADNLLIGLLNGKIVVVREHSRVNKKGNSYTVNAHFRKKSA